MPTYQYRCTECGHDLEAVQKFTDDPLTECPKCHGQLRKVYNAVGVVFKGAGFYKTDSRKDTTAIDSSKPTKEIPASTPAKEVTSSSASTTSSSKPSTDK